MSFPSSVEEIERGREQAHKHMFEELQEEIGRRPSMGAEDKGQVFEHFEKIKANLDQIFDGMAGIARMFGSHPKVKRGRDANGETIPA